MTIETSSATTAVPEKIRHPLPRVDQARVEQVLGLIDDARLVGALESAETALLHDLAPDLLGAGRIEHAGDVVVVLAQVAHDVRRDAELLEHLAGLDEALLGEREHLLPRHARHDVAVLLDDL